MEHGVIQQSSDYQHFDLDIRGTLRNLKGRKRNAKSYANHDDGRPMTNAEFEEYLLDQLSKGRQVLPVGDCDNFDYQTGCRGHGNRKVVEDWYFETGNG